MLFPVQLKVGDHGQVIAGNAGDLMATGESGLQPQPSPVIDSIQAPAWCEGGVGFYWAGSNSRFAVGGAV